LSQYIATVGNTNSLDDGNVANQVAGIVAAVTASATSSLAWNSATAYAVNQFVTYNGLLYVALAGSTNSVPPSTNWLEHAAGLLSLSVAGNTNVALTQIQSVYRILSFTGTLTGSITVNATAGEPRVWTVFNNTTGAFMLTAGVTGGTGISVPQGYAQTLWTDGTNVYPAGLAVSLTGVFVASTAAPFTTTTQVATMAAVYAAQAAVQGARNKLRIVATGVNNYGATITANAIELYNPTTGSYLTVRAVNTGIAINTSGIGGLSTGTLAASTFYYAYVAYNPTTATTAAFADPSSTVPTLPVGYTFYAYVGDIGTDSSGNKYLYNTIQTDRRVTYVTTTSSNTATLRSITALGSGLVTVAGVIIPINATAIDVQGFCPSTTNNAYFQVGPNTNNPNVLNFTIGASGYVSGFLSKLIPLENTQIYTTTSAGSVSCLGWEAGL
jgi:hypothetical protein